MAREMIEPTRALDTIVTEGVRPYHQALASILRDLLGPEAGDETVRLCTLSILGQCAYYHHGRQVIRRLYPEQNYGAENIERLADHIIKFSLAGVNECSRLQRKSNE
jgi:hypothetical protein